MQEEFLDQSIALAKMIQENFSNKLQRTDRKVKQAGFIVLHQTFMPSVLVETGFLTNKEEGAYLNSSKGQAEMGKAIAAAVLNYKEGVKPSNSSKEIVQTKTPEEPFVEQKEEVTKAVKEAVAIVEKPEKEKVSNTEDTKPETSSIVKTKEAMSSEEVAQSVVFKVQLMASGKNLPLVSENFKGLSNISQEPYKNLYRYMYGETRSYREAKMMQSLASDKGYPTAYIVAYRLGERVPLKEVVTDL